jgi:endonuclease YncB( thermonuclease family)
MGAPRSPRRQGQAARTALRNITLLACAGIALWLVERGYTDPLAYAALAGIAIGATLVCLPAPRRRRGQTLDAFAARDGAAGRSRPLRGVFVIDGDTIDDVRTGIRYRFQNIDAPETGDNALCESERQLGERAKWEAIKLVRAARRIEARPTGEIDQYGRTLAYIIIDGVDLGEALVSRGLARPWQGRRELWCGPDGSLLLIARQRGDAFMCQHCRLQWRP